MEDEQGRRNQDSLRGADRHPPEPNLSGYTVLLNETSRPLVPACGAANSCRLPVPVGSKSEQDSSISQTEKPGEYYFRVSI